MDDGSFIFFNIINKVEQNNFCGGFNRESDLEKALQKIHRSSPEFMVKLEY